MKKVLAIFVASLLLASCGVGNYTVVSGLEDMSAISFTAPDRYELVVEVDGIAYDMKAVKTKSYKSDRKIKETALNTLRLAPGKHQVKVSYMGEEVFSKTLLLSNGEHRVIDL